jgi:hypothetical protein
MPKEKATRMSNEKRNRNSMIAPAVIAVAGLGYFLAARPWHLRWGTTDEELGASLPSDEISAEAAGQATHAVTIDAPPKDVWPWILQIGQDRGGFYSYTYLENLAGCRMRNVSNIVPEWQNRAAGDTVWFATPKHFGGRARMVAAIVEPERAMVLATPEDWPEIQSGKRGRGPTWAFILKPTYNGGTRLLARTHGKSQPGLWSRVANLSFWEPAHFVMERKMLLTIKQMAQKTSCAKLPPA